MAAGPYVTADRFKLGGFGIDVSSMSNIALNQTLRRASTMVNTFCNAAMLPQPFDFRGGEVVGEQHIFPVPDRLVDNPGSRRIFVSQRPLRAITAFRLQFTTTYEITLPTSNLFVNTNEGWCEIIASQPTIIGYPPIGYWYGLYEPVAFVSYTYGYQNAVVDDVCDSLSPKIWYATYGQWDATAAIEVQVDGVVADPSGYAVNRASGAITFTASPASGAEVTASYVTTLPDAITHATGIIAVDLLGKSRIAARGMVGLQSLKVAEVTLTQMSGGGGGRYVSRNGVSIPEDAAALLGSFALGSAA